MVELGVLGAVLLSQLVEPMPTPVPERQACLSLAAPSYFYPGPQWDQLLSLAPTLEQAVINPTSGAGPGPDPNYLEVVARAHAAGVAVLGYVPTHYATREPMEILAEVDAYLDWYGVDGFFLDEVTSGPDGVPYYAGVVAAIRERGPTTVALNPGAVPAEPYLWIGDQVVVFEGPLAEYRAFQAPAWFRTYAANRFWTIVYGVEDTSEVPTLARVSRENHVQRVWATNDQHENPYDVAWPELGALPTMLASECLDP